MEREDFTPREEFLRGVEPFFSNGLAYEIYFHEKGSIMNLVNCLYVASIYSDDDDGDQVGIMIPKSIAKKAVTNWPEFLIWFDSLSDHDKRKTIMIFNPETLEVAKEIKARTDIEGPTKDVDLKWEQRLKTGQGLNGERPSHGFLGRLKRLFQGGV